LKPLNQTNSNIFFSTPHKTSLQTINVNGNPSNTEFLIIEELTGLTVKTDGSLTTGTVWATYASFGGAGGITVTNLDYSTVYTFKVKARNSGLTETADQKYFFLPP